MKRILITGANSYIGTSFEQYLEENFSNEYVIETVDMETESWKQKDFSPFDSVFHVAGIAHSDNGAISAKQERLYYAINTDLAIETARKAKADGVKQFIYMSSAIVYGDSAPIGEKKIITKDTPEAPANCYGDSKLQGEIGVRQLSDDHFHVVVLRPPMIYGKGSKGNYPLLAKIAKLTPVFPYIENERSMLYIENLCEFVRLMVENKESGIFFPQNGSYSNTSELVQMIGTVKNKGVVLVKGFTPALKLLSKGTALVNKAFGNFVYDQEMSQYKMDYRVVKDLQESIQRTEA